jgi:predicted Zn-dependent protease
MAELRFVGCAAGSRDLDGAQVTSRLTMAQTNASLRISAMRAWRRFSVLLWVVCFAGGGWLRHSREPPVDQLWTEAHGWDSAGDWDRAETALRRLLARDPERFDARRYLADLARRGDDWPTVAAVLEPVPDADPNALAVRITQGDAAFKLNDPTTAERYWLRARRIDPSALVPRRRLLYLYAIQLRRREWSALLWELYDQELTTMREMLQLMIADHVVWESDEMIAILRGFVATTPGDAHSVRALATYLLHRGDVNSASQRLENLREANPDDGETWLALAECRLAVGDVDAVRRLIDQPPNGLKRDPRFAKIQGFVALAEFRYDEAIEKLREALRKRWHDSAIHHKLAQAYRLSGELTSAERHERLSAVLAKIERLCNALQAAGWQDETVRELVRLCQEASLIEEARGWVRLSRTQVPDDPFFREQELRLARMPTTSSRRPPTMEPLP